MAPCSTSTSSMFTSRRFTLASLRHASRRTHPTPINRRIAYWLVPAGTAATLYLLPTPQSSLFPAFFSSPTCIPCSSPPHSHTVISSPNEEQRSIVSRLCDFIHDHICEPILTTTRFIYLFILFVPVIVSSPIILLGAPDPQLHGDRWGAIRWYDLLVTQMQRAGPTFIKLAQWAGSRTDLFPSALCDRLAALHSHARPHSLRHTKRVIEKVFQRPFDQIFEEFDPVPIGTGAIAQVYRATLKKDLIPPSYLGPKRSSRFHPASLAPVILHHPPPSVPSAAVAIKVLHPRVAQTIARDLAIMSFFAHLVTLFPAMHWISLPEEVDVFGRMMFEQLDLRHEARNLVRFEHNFAKRKVPVLFPRPLQLWSTKDILVEEYANALPLEMLLKQGGGPFEDQVATVGLDAFLNMLLLDNFVHADLHPGNIMVTFSKPPSAQALLRNLFSGGKPPIPGAMSDADRSDADTVVARLRAAAGDPARWHAELRALAAARYVPEVVFLDAGLVTTLDAQNRRNFLDLFQAVAEFDGHRAGRLMVARCRTPELAVDTETFALKMQHIVLSVKRKTFSLGQIKISDILRDVLKAVRTHHVKMEGDFINTVISILLLEGIGRQLDPELDLFKSALPILRQLGRQMSVQENIGIPSGEFGAFLKLWVWMEARQLAAAAVVDIDDFVKYDRLVQSI